MGLESGPSKIEKVCLSCQGSGEDENGNKCKTCHGSGTVNKS